VKDGEVLFTRGYGKANVEKGEPVLADKTLFRIASITKLFTTTAVMQLAEEGKLDLHRDINTYLTDVEIPNTYPGRPLTLHHLLTHSAGFEEHYTGSGARDASDVEPLDEYLSEQMPARVRPPGEVSSYSNYGMSLAGLVVQEVSGVPFDRYVEENVLDPLRMESTTTVQPPVPKLRERLATGYDVEGGEPVARPLRVAALLAGGALDAGLRRVAGLLQPARLPVLSAQGVGPSRLQ
jgi:CubicO group peptidase (beta-lactamase class C family)